MSVKGSQYVRHHTDAQGQIGQEGLGAGLGEAHPDVDGLLARGQRLLAAAAVGEVYAEVVQACRQIRQEGVGAASGEASIDVSSLLVPGQCLLVATEVA